MLIIAAALVVAMGGMGCSSENEGGTEGVIEHPIDDRIPFHDEATAVTKQQTLSACPDPPDVLRMLARVLDSSRAIDTTQTDILVESSQRVEATSISDRRLALLVEHPENRLYELNRQNQNTSLIASEGRGPGQVQFASSIAQQDDTLFLGSKDRRILQFDCRSRPCTFEDETRLQFSPETLTILEDQVAVVGTPMLQREGMTMEDFTGAVHLVGPTGDIRTSIGRPYHTSHFLVLSSYLRGSSLVHSEPLQTVGFASQKLPYIWIYRDSGGKERVWRIDDFEPLGIEYSPSDRSRSKEYQDSYSLLRLQGPLQERYLVASVRHMAYVSEGSDIRMRSVDYYALDMETGRSYYLGRDVPRKGVFDRLFLVSNESTILIENGRVALLQ